MLLKTASIPWFLYITMKKLMSRVSSFDIISLIGIFMNDAWKNFLMS